MDFIAKQMGAKDAGKTKQNQQRLEVNSDLFHLVTAINLPPGQETCLALRVIRGKDSIITV